MRAKARAILLSRPGPVLHGDRNGGLPSLLEPAQLTLQPTMPSLTGALTHRQVPFSSSPDLTLSTLSSILTRTTAVAPPQVLVILLSECTLRAVDAATATTLWHIPEYRLGVSRPSAVPSTIGDGATSWMYDVTGVRLHSLHDKRNDGLPEFANILRLCRVIRAIRQWPEILRRSVADGSTLVSDPNGTLLSRRRPRRRLKYPCYLL